MGDRRSVLSVLRDGVAVAAAGLAARRVAAAPVAPTETFPFTLTDAEWRQRLDTAQYAVLRQESTERAGTSPLNAEHRPGVFACAGCGQPLFASSTKFESGTGWPSFWAPLDKAVAGHADRRFGFVRNEVHCSRCGGHLGHVFDDGPKPTGQRYCMNGVALSFVPAAA